VGLVRLLLWVMEPQVGNLWWCMGLNPDWITHVIILLLFGLTILTHDFLVEPESSCSLQAYLI